MRKEFLKKIKDFQKKRDDNLKTSDPSETTQDEQDFELEFNKSLMFLKNVAESHKLNEKKALGSMSDTKEIEISLSLPKSLRQSDINNTKEPLSIILDNMPEISVKSGNAIIKPLDSIVKPLTLAPRPPYSSLKNSIHPTYREWTKTQKVSQKVNVPQVFVHDMPIPEESERSVKLNAYKKDHKEDIIKTKKKTRTIKRLLGKTGRSVSVLIKSRQTRKKIQCEQAKLNQTGIHEIKKYLRDRNMIKTGSNSPNDVLRKLYEQCILAGDITNKGDNILIHNFLNV